MATNRKIANFIIGFKDLSSSNPTEYFNPEYESIATEFNKKYDAEQNTVQNNTSLIEEILNENITEAKIKFAFDKLKTKKSACIDGLPAEFLKECREILTPHITIAINYIIECRCFPTDWSSGIRSAIYKQGKRNIVDNYRGITILPIMEKYLKRWLIIALFSWMRPLMKLIDTTVVFAW